MSIEGTVKDGVVVLDVPACIVDGTRVVVVVKETPRAASPLGQMLLKHAGTVEGLPEDMAAQHDHYIHGTPKR